MQAPAMMVNRSVVRRLRERKNIALNIHLGLKAPTGRVQARGCAPVPPSPACQELTRQRLERIRTVVALA